MLTKLSKLGTAMVDILVGPSKEVFRVHKEYVQYTAPSDA